MFNRPEPSSLSTVLGELIERLGWHEKIYLLRISENWKELVGDKFADISEPKSLKDGILTIETGSSTWRAEIFYRRDQIIEKINDLIGLDAVKELLIR